ncbi:DinB family protein [Aestuariivivens sediminis]|uniref:DinB family protein n=1 Tax=Aestuariivivens sediminis TaxID=2913557 RepID=UPI001F595F54|nr:DinB family protein [Aestuariivivens sediminis]
MTFMTISSISTQLEQNRTVFDGLLHGKSETEFLWRPEAQKWCLLEIACHLLDEEQEDFKARIKYIFERPEGPMPSINPPAWVTERNYISKDYETVVQSFLEERKQSVIWLREHMSANWDQSIHHAQLGVMSARLFLHNWLAHDYLHIRQIVRLQYAFLKQQGGLNLNYAGNW